MAALRAFIFDIDGTLVVALSCGGTSAETLRTAGAVALYRDPADLLEHYCDLISDL
jgi:hypothetical protein